jgi:hypothetical protein
MFVPTCTCDYLTVTLVDLSSGTTVTRLRTDFFWKLQSWCVRKQQFMFPDDGRLITPKRAGERILVKCVSHEKMHAVVYCTSQKALVIKLRFKNQQYRKHLPPLTYKLFVCRSLNDSQHHVATSTTCIRTLTDVSITFMVFETKQT